jgi:tetratricopeptide (TPR) repeat protein
MPTRPSKTVVISSAPGDSAAAMQLRSILSEYLADEVWLRDFDLTAGALVADAIDTPIADAKWFLLLLSTNSLATSWLRIEANLATLRAIEDEDFKLVVLKLDKTNPPLHLAMALKFAEVIDLSEMSDWEGEFIRLADHIESTTSTRSREIVYVDRGADADRFALAARRNQIIVILGWPGIGKSAFANHTVSAYLSKRPITVPLSRGHSLDLLCRQVLRGAHALQPTGTAPADSVSDAQLLATAMDALKIRSDTHFLFLDNAEQGLDASNDFFSYLRQFLDAFVNAKIGTHLIIATTRNPEIPVPVAGETDIFKLGAIEDLYIKECLDLWLQGTRNHDHVMAQPELDEVIQSIGGHPLAARMVASYLKVKTLRQLLAPTETKRFQLKLADYMLRTHDQDQLVLTHLHQLILMTLAAVGQPLTLEDILAVSELRQHPLQDVQEARIQLADMFLIEHDGELMYLHRFVETYYRDRLSEQSGRFTTISKEVGEYAFKRAVDLNAKLTSALKTDPGEAARLSGEVFRYAIPAGRLLRAVGANEMAESLPIQVRGTLRELVFYFYQDQRDYKEALKYAERWLTLNPTDLEVQLYRIRCYRNNGDRESLTKAEKLLQHLERLDYRGRYAERLYREKALIAQSRGNLQGAKEFFLEGINNHRAHAAPDNHIGLAQLLLREIDDLPFYAPERRQAAVEALKFLEVAREESATFDRFHLGTYVEALIHAGREDKAMPLLIEALTEKPNDGRLNYRMAEILRNREEYDHAERYAKTALRHGAEKARLTLANILHARAVRLMAGGGEGTGVLEEALHVVSEFRPEYGHDQEVVDAITAKIYRALGRVNDAKARLEKYDDNDNPYTVYERGKCDQIDAEAAAAEAHYGKALSVLQQAMERITSYQQKRGLSPPLQELAIVLQTERSRIGQIIKGGEK